MLFRWFDLRCCSTGYLFCYYMILDVMILDRCFDTIDTTRCYDTGHVMIVDR
jgi:hypothetical protein